MKHKTTKNTNKQSTKARLNKKWIIGAFIALFIVAQLVFDGVFVWQRMTSSPSAEPYVATVIFRAIEDMYSPAPVDAKSGAIYISEAGVTLPPSSLRNVWYAYHTDEAEPFMLSFTTQQMISDGKNNISDAYNNVYVDRNFSLDKDEKAFLALFNELPGLQACARGVQLFDQPQTDDKKLTAQGSKRLSDGRTLYLYTEDSCKQKDALGSLLQLVKQIDVY